jgi:amidohydrolase
MNAISEEAEMHGTCRFFDPGQEELFRERITAVAENTAASFRAKAEVSIVPGCPAVINDAGMCAIAREAVSELLGPEAVASLPKSCTNEDFSYYGQLAPSVMLWAGTAGPGREYPLHSPYFDLEEQALISMPAMHVQFALDFLGCREE